MTSPLIGRQVRAEILVGGVGGPELAIEVRELAAGVPQEQPPRDAVVHGAQIEEQKQDAGADEDAVLPKEQRLCTAPGNSARQPASRRSGRVESAARNAALAIIVVAPRTPGRRGSSVICRPSGFTRTNSFGHVVAHRRNRPARRSVSRLVRARVPGV